MTSTRLEPDHAPAGESRALRTETRLGMIIEWDVPIRMNDGTVLRADIFRPAKEGRFPVLMSHGPYGKLLHFEDGYKTAWDRMVDEHPDVAAGSSNAYQSWEVADPEKWVPHDYICVRVDSRGAIAASARCTSEAVSSVSRTAPSSSLRAFTLVPRYKVTVRGDSPSTP